MSTHVPDGGPRALAVPTSPSCRLKQLLWDLWVQRARCGWWGTGVPGHFLQTLERGWGAEHEKPLRHCPDMCSP